MATADDVPRFEIILSDTDLEKIVKDKDSKETQKVIKVSYNMFRQYLEERHANKLHLLYVTGDGVESEADVTNLSRILRAFYAETRKV